MVIVTSMRRVTQQPAPDRAVRVELLESLAPLRSEWPALAERARNIFATWDWADAWWRHFGRGRPLLVAAARREDRLVAVAPLYLSSGRPLAIARFVGYGAGDQLGPVCAPEDRDAGAAACEEALARAPWRWDVFFGEQLAVEERWRELLGGRRLVTTESPVLPLGPGTTWSGYLASRSANLRQQLRRWERRLGREHRVELRLVREPSELEEGFAALLRLHEARWPEGSEFARAGAFHRDFARRALERGWLRLWLLELDDRVAAAWYGFRFAGVESYYQAGRDPRLTRERLGLVLLAHSIREAIADGMDEYRFLRGGEEYKLRFADQGAGLETIGIAGGLRGALALRVAPVFVRWRPRWVVDRYHGGGPGGR